LQDFDSGDNKSPKSAQVGRAGLLSDLELLELDSEAVIALLVSVGRERPVREISIFVRKAAVAEVDGCLG